MKHKKVIVIQAGGYGTRLYPFSTPETPKQFIKFERNSLFQKTCLRIRELFKDQYKIIVLGNILSKHHIIEQINEIKFSIDLLLIQPNNKETATALLHTAIIIKERWGNDCLIHFMPSDHLFETPEKIKTSLEKAESILKNKKTLIGYGVLPSKFSKQYGIYKISHNNHIDKFFTSLSNKDFLELQKTNLLLWDIGLLTTHVDFFINIFKENCFSFFKSCMNSIKTIENLSPSEITFSNTYNAISPISIAKDIMPYLRNMHIIKIDIKWADVGSWSNFYDWYSSSTTSYEKNMISYNAKTQSMIIGTTEERKLCPSSDFKISLIKENITLHENPEYIDQKVKQEYAKNI